MCGIAGIYSRNKTGLPERVRAATGSLTHRGPEKEAFYFNADGNLRLGHRRLCIIDLSEEATQPLRYLERYTIIYNGEVYNYLEVKEQLVKKGYHFHTQSDTEVIAAAYAAYGEKCLAHFDGMFAFAIWDEQEQHLFAARDRMGEKPFYYYRDEDQFAFASEIKGLWAMDIAQEVNAAMLYNFLTIGYTSNPSDPQETFYKDIYQLPAASFLSYRTKSNELYIERYWQAAIDIDNTINEETAVERFKQLFTNSIQRRLRSDVPVGTSLSGGLDSSAIVAWCHQQQSSSYTHKCFTAVFDGFSRNEEKYASLVAKAFGLEHHLVRIDDNEITNLMNRMMWYQEQPVSSASPLVQYKVYEAARQNGVTVLLDGQGADELLAGYSRYYKWYWQELYRNKELQLELSAARKLGIKESFDWRAKLAARFPQFAAAIWEGRKAKKAYQQKDLDRDYAFAHKQQLYYALPATPDLNGALYYNSFVNGLDELLHLADRNSMAHSVEVRLPFLNHELIEFLFTLPPHFKIQKGWTKWLLRKACENSLPKEIVWRKDKVGFEPPQQQWMKNPQVQEAIMEGRKKLVHEGILQSSVLNYPVKEKEAHAADSMDWRYWSASYLFTK